MKPGEETTTAAESSSAAEAKGGEAGPDIYAVFGAEPEVTAYALAKYSRSALSLRESLRELDEQRAEKFLQTFYFDYGHRSIADLAHVTLAVERLSILAAIEVADESKWDGQERSTRYQAFAAGAWATPPELAAGEGEAYGAAMARLFAAYEGISERVREHYRATVARPAEMKAEAYERVLRARAFDAGRYLLPLGTNTSLGQIVSARVLETQISRLLSSPYGEVRAVGEALRAAASRPAHDPRAGRLAAARAFIAARSAEPGGAAALAAAEALARPTRVAPTLAKHTAASEYLRASRRELAAAARELLGAAGAGAEAPSGVDLLEADEPLETQVAASLLYGETHASYRQVAAAVAGLSAARREEILELGLRHRGPHDELLRPFQAGQRFRFDLLLDAGAYRDLHRHRRCVQLAQDYTFAHGFDAPAVVEEAGAGGEFAGAMRAARAAAERLTAGRAYLLPLGYRRRCLFQMDLAEAAYIAEQRTTPAGHPSYRRIAWEMFQAVARRHPALTRGWRVTDPAAAVDLLRR